MSSLSSLNGRTIEFTDNRSPNVVFDFPVAFDISEVGESNVLTLKRNIDILDVVKPDLANCKFIVDVSSVAGTVMDWGTLPAGVTVTEINGVYTVEGIDSQAIWDTIKEPTITIPAGFQGSFSYDCVISFFNGTEIVSLEWTVGTFVPVSNFVSTATMTIEPKKTVGFVSTDFVSSFSLVQIFNQAQLIANTTLSAIPEYIFTEEYLELIEDGFYDPLTPFNISDYSPRITNTSAAPSTVYDLEITSETPDVRFSLSETGDTVDAAIPSYSGEFAAFLNNGTKLATSTATSPSTLRVYSFPDMTLEYTDSFFDTGVTGKYIGFTRNGNWAFAYSDTTRRVWKVNVPSQTEAEKLDFETSNLPRAVSLNSAGNVLVAKLENDTAINMYSMSFAPDVELALNTFINSIPRPANVTDWGWSATEHSHFNENDSWIQHALSGNKFLVGATYNGDYATYLITVSNFSPLVYSSVAFRQTGTNYKINDCVKNTNFTLFGFGNKLYDDQFNLIQTFDNNILAISNDETAVVTVGTNGDSFVFRGDTAGYTFDSTISGNDNYFEISQDDDGTLNFLSASNYAVEKTTANLVISGTKTEINTELNNLKLIADLLPSESEPYDFVVNYNLVMPSLEYNRVVYFNDFTVSANLNAAFNLDSIIGKIKQSNAALTANISIAAEGYVNVIQLGSNTFTASSSLTASGEIIKFASAHVQLLDLTEDAGAGTTFSVSVPSSIQNLDGLRILIHTDNFAADYIQEPAGFSFTRESINPGRGVYKAPYVSTATTPYSFQINSNSFYMSKTLRLSVDNNSQGWEFSGTGNTVSFNLPSSIYETGDLLLLYVIARATSTISPVTTAPSGWSSVSFDEETYLNHHANAIAGKVVTDTNIVGTPVTWNFNTVDAPELTYWYAILERIIDE